MYQQLIFKLLLKNVAISGHSNEKKQVSLLPWKQNVSLFNYLYFNIAICGWILLSSDKKILKALFIFQKFFFFIRHFKEDAVILKHANNSISSTQQWAF